MRLIFVSKHDMTKKDAWPATPMITDRIKSDTLRNGKENYMLEKSGRCSLPMNIQFFAEPPAGTEGSEPPQQGQIPAIDYAKIQQMLDGTLAAKEDVALKAYFKQQGLSQQEAEQAMETFKQQKAANTPDINAMQTQITQAQQMAQQANIEKEAMFMSGELGVDLKTMPFILKLADLNNVADDKGNINKETLKTALNKVLEDLPQLKPTANQQQGGFRQIGAGGQGGTPNLDDQLSAIFGNKK